MRGLNVAIRSLESALGCEASVTVIGLCANGVLRGENKSIVHEPTDTSGTDSDTIHELLFVQSQQISSSDRPNTLETRFCWCPIRATLLLKLHWRKCLSWFSPHHLQVVSRHAHEFLQCFRPLDALSGLYPVYRDTWSFTHSMFCSSNCAFDNKRKRSMSRKRSQSRLPLMKRETRCV